MATVIAPPTVYAAVGATEIVSPRSLRLVSSLPKRAAAERLILGAA